jgi:hypothetical protein
MKSKALALFSLVAMLAFAQTLLAADDQPQAKKKRQPGTIGKVKSVDATANTITLTIRERGKKKAAEGAEKAKPTTMDKTFKLAKECKVTIGTEDKTLADVKTDMLVALTVGDNGEVSAIRKVEPGKKKKQPNT